MHTPGLRPDTPSFAILGAGAIGGFLAAALMKGGYPVTLVVRPGTEEAFQAEGISIRSALIGDGTYFPNVVHTLTEAPSVLFITVKSPALRDALSQVARGVERETMVVPLLNGFEHVEKIRDSSPGQVVVGMIGGIVAERTESGVIVSSSTDVHIELASRDVASDALGELARILSQLGIATRVLPRETEVIWRKLARLSVLSALTAASGKMLGDIRTDPEWRELMKRCVEESSMVAEREGVDIPAHELLKQIDTLPATLTTSLARDVARGDVSEADAILGAVIRKGEAHGIPMPTFIELLRSIEKMPL